MPMLAEGDTPMTISGRRTEPFPKVDTSTNRKASNTLRRVERWLLSQAVAEADSRGDHYAAHTFRLALDRPTQCDKDMAHTYLFGSET